MFPGTFKFNTLEEYDELQKQNREHMSKEISKMLKSMKEDF